MKYFIITLILFFGCVEKQKLTSDQFSKMQELVKVHIEHGQYNEANNLVWLLLNRVEIIKEANR